MEIVKDSSLVKALAKKEQDSEFRPPEFKGQIHWCSPPTSLFLLWDGRWRQGNPQKLMGQVCWHTEHQKQETMFLSWSKVATDTDGCPMTSTWCHGIQAHIHKTQNTLYTHIDKNKFVKLQTNTDMVKLIKVFVLNKMPPTLMDF